LPALLTGRKRDIWKEQSLKRWEEKGYLERAVTEAIQRWIYEKRQEKIAEEALKLLETGFDFGKRLYKDRSDLYER
jgi:hypothetical protein